MSSFYETIFLKNDTSLEKELFLLMNNKYSNNEEIRKKEKGLYGENQVAYHLKKSNIGMYVLRDIRLEYEDLKAQIDFVVVTSHHCYFIECKNYNADIIHVDESSNFEESTRYGKKYKKKAIPSPISQVEDQLTVLKKICLREQEKVKELLTEIKFKDYFKTLVVFTNSNNRLNLEKAPKDIKYRILKVDNLIRQIEYDEKHSEGKKYSQEQILNIAKYILNKNVEFKIEEIKDEVKPNNNSREALIISILGGIGSIILAIFVLFYLSGGFNYKGKKPTSNYLTNNQIKALELFKEGYYDSQTEGFTILHTSVCREINKFFNNDISCNMYPIEVNYKEENEISFYRPSSKTCYILNLSTDKKQVKEAKYNVTYDDSCRGYPIGFVEWDDNNEFYKKIGGYNKVKELAIYVYNNGQFNTWDFDQSNIVARGGNQYYFSTYFQNVNFYFLGVTGVMSNIQYDTTKDNFNKMVESYYYIMK